MSKTKTRWIWLNRYAHHVQARIRNSRLSAIDAKTRQSNWLWHGAKSWLLLDWSNARSTHENALEAWIKHVWVSCIIRSGKCDRVTFLKSSFWQSFYSRVNIEIHTITQPNELTLLDYMIVYSNSSLLLYLSTLEQLQMIIRCYRIQSSYG